MQKIVSTILSGCIIGTIVFVFFGTIALAQNKVEKSSQCWTAEECSKQNGVWQEGGEFLGYTCGYDWANRATGLCYEKNDPIPLQVPIPNTAGGNISSVDNFSIYLAIVYKFFVYAIGIVAVAYLGWGGFQWLMAAGDAGKITEAKNTIQGAIIGLLLAAGSFVLLNVINSRLVTPKVFKIPKIKPLYLTTQYCSDLTGNVILQRKDNGTQTPKNETECGVEYVIDGDEQRTCWGLGCNGTDSCIRTSVKKDGECKDAKTYCNSLDTIDAAKTEANALGYHSDIIPLDLNILPLLSDTKPVLDSYCKSISDAAKSTFATDGQCAWWQCAGCVPSARYGGCYWYEKSVVQNGSCAGIETCDDLNSHTFTLIIDEAQNGDFPACFHDWCGSGCHIEDTTTGYYQCFPQ